MRHSILLAILIAVLPLHGAYAQVAGAGNFHIAWEVKNRFRLFRNETDFLRMVAASRGDGILAAEDRLEHDSAGLGWAKDVVDNLCLDKTGNLLQTCERDGVSENYLVPQDHAIGVALSGQAPQDAICVWTFDDGNGPLKQDNAPCDQEVRLRVRYGRTTVATVDIPLGDGTAQRVVTEIAVRDVLIAGLGDSIAAGEGNPDRAVELEGSFCFGRFLGGVGSQYFRPGRAGYGDDRSCENGPASPAAALDWARHGARWMNPACHRSLYSYQVRTALALAIEQPHLAVTFLPLACTGAATGAGMFASQRADDCPWVVGIETCSGRAPAQFTELKDLMAAAHRQDPQRSLDMVLLTIGANDISFGALLANVIVDAATERLLLRQGGALASVADAQKSLDDDLPDDFAQLRTALKSFVGGNLARVVFVSYANPAMQAANQPCPGGRDGLDVHPAFSADKDRLRAAAEFVDNQFLPKLKLLATCDDKATCHDPMADRMTFVDGHQAAFESHGMCTHGADDPPFDRACFSQSGNSFQADLTKAADNPMACGQSASDYQPYAHRARWIRTANDSYFTAMTYPEGMPVVLKPSNIHDALWGVLSAVYGGAVHPNAEGYAAMADAALPAARQVLGLPAPPTVSVEPLPPPAAPAASLPLPPPTAPATPAPQSTPVSPPAQ
jgi:hypothetical protein